MMTNLQMTIFLVFIISILDLISAGSNTEINLCVNTDQEVCQRLYPTDCNDVRDNQGGCSGVYTIYLGRYKKPVKVFCEMEPNTTWTVFQRRLDGREDFSLDWSSYEAGFGDLNGEHWIGNIYLNLLTNQRRYRLKISLENFLNEKRYAEYGVFNVESHVDKYRLIIGNYSGNAGDSMSYHNGRKFTTNDEDNDEHPDNCAVLYKGGWWYNGCHHANLNGLYLTSEHSSQHAEGVDWWHFMKHDSLKFTEMKLTRN